MSKDYFQRSSLVVFNDGVMSIYSFVCRKWKGVTVTDSRDAIWSEYISKNYLIGVFWVYSVFV